MAVERFWTGTDFTDKVKREKSVSLNIFAEKKRLWLKKPNVTQVP